MVRAPDLRDVVAFETILSGDLLGDDEPGFKNTSDNSKNVVTASLFTDDTAVMDGLTTCGGFALNQDEGCGFHNLGGIPVIENCTFRTNFADTGGGGFFSSAQGSPTLHNCVLENKLSNSWGGCIWIQIGTAEIVGGTFVNKTGDPGGGLAVFGTGDFEIVHVLDSTFMASTATQGGGGISVDGADEFTISNCQFHESDAGSNPAGGGGVILGGPATLADWDFDANTALGSGDPPIVDMGAYELQVKSPCPWDLNSDGSVGVGDLLILLAAWGPNPGHPADFDGGRQNLSSLIVYSSAIQRMREADWQSIPIPAPEGLW